MIPELGFFSLICTLSFCFLQCVAPIVKQRVGLSAGLAVLRNAAIIQFILIALSFACLTYAFITHDFSLSYVVEYSDYSLPLFYCIGAVWGGHEGSVLLWLLMLQFWVFVLNLSTRHLNSNDEQQFFYRVFTILNLLSLGFLLYVLKTSNPFLRNYQAIPLVGRDLNPVLQDPGLIIHPPLLYMGYVGFALVFALGLAALFTEQFERRWAKLARPWALFSWLFLTLGIVLGSWWAYHELGWGGWWFWDPVENASFLPWLVATALIHSLITVEKRGVFKSWTILLAISTFCLSLLGTFLVRSGVLVSVHAFANDPARGIYLLKYLFTVLLVSLGIFAWRAPGLKNENQFDYLSKETLILVSNILLLVSMLTILLGTIYPLVLDALGQGKLSVGLPYFNLVFVPLMLPLLLCMGLGPSCFWSSMRVQQLLLKIRWPLLGSAIFSVLLAVTLFPQFNFKALLGLFFAAWVASTSWQSFYANRKSRDTTRYSMLIAHLGVAITVVGVSLNTQYSLERDVRVAPQETITLGQYGFKFIDTEPLRGPNYQGITANFEVSKKGKFVTNMRGEKRVYLVDKMPFTHAAIRAGFFSDLYLALGEPLNQGAWSVRLYYKPFVRWIWLGGMMMVLAGLIAVFRRTEEK